MNNKQKVTVAGDLIRIHHVITRALSLSIEEIGMFEQKEGISESLREGFINYLRSLLSLFHSHHLVEDDLIFPYFKKNQLSAPYETMNEQHQALLPVLDNFEKSIDNWVNDPSNQEFIANLRETLEQLQQLWIPHFQLEEEYLCEEKISSLLSDEEQVKLAHEFGEYAAKHIDKDYLVIPFILYNLSPEERALMSKIFPSNVTEELVPHIWKDQWESMSPFFLL
jgi:hemerythrin-like domain-containing protein